MSTELLNQIYVDEMQEMVGAEIVSALDAVKKNKAEIAKLEAERAQVCPPEVKELEDKIAEALANKKNKEALRLRKELKKIYPSSVLAGLDFKLERARNWRLSNSVAPMMFWGPPGSAKTQGITHAVKNLTNEKGLRVALITTFMSAYDQVALRGMPTIDRENEVTVWYPQESFPSELNCADYDVVVWMLDELSAASRPVQPVLYRLLQEGQIEGMILPKNVMMIAAGNDKDDRAIAMDMSSAMSNRMVHFDVRPSLDPWKQWAIQSGVHPMVIAYHNSNQGQNLHNMDTSVVGMMKAFPTYRTWEKVSDDVYKYHKKPERLLDLRVIGHVGPVAGIEFNTFFKLFDQLPDPEGILDGKVEAVPKEDDIIYATLSNLVACILKKHTPERMDNFFKYISAVCETRDEMGYMAINDMFRSKNNTVIQMAMKTAGWTRWASKIINMQSWS